MPEPLRLRALQTRLLRPLLGAAPSTSRSLAAYLSDLEREVDRSTIDHYRAGRRTAPLGLLVALIDHQDRDGQQAVLSALVRLWGFDLAEDPESDDDEDSHPERSVTEVAGQAGQVLNALLSATDPDSPGGEALTPDEARCLVPMLRSCKRAVRAALRQVEARSEGRP